MINYIFHDLENTEKTILNIQKNLRIGRRKQRYTYAQIFVCIFLLEAASFAEFRKIESLEKQLSNFNEEVNRLKAIVNPDKDKENIECND